MTFPEELRQHELLNEMLGRLEMSAKSGANEPFGPQLRELRRQIRQHFEYEETEGSLRNAVSGSPQFQQQLESLLRQHRILTQNLDELIRTAEAMDRSGTLPADFLPTVVSFIRAFQDHEHHENRLLQEAANETIGEVD
jgi:hypothetical protein